MGNWLLQNEPIDRQTGMDQRTDDGDYEKRWVSAHITLVAENQSAEPRSDDAAQQGKYMQYDFGHSQPLPLCLELIEAKKKERDES